MGDIIASASDYNSIRFKLGVSSNMLSDTEINSLGFLPLAEAMVKELVTNWAAIMAGSTSSKTYLQAGTLCLVAAFACTALDYKTSQSFGIGDYSEGASKTNWPARREELAQEARELIVGLNPDLPNIARRRLFTKNGATRSGATWPLIVDQWYARIYPHITTWLDTNGIITHGWEVQP